MIILAIHCSFLQIFTAENAKVAEKTVTEPIQ